MAHIKAPWTPEQVKSLNESQHNDRFHPYTCGGDRGDEAHVKYAADHDEHDEGILVATENGWLCPVCGYTQDWAHDFSA